jgi:hypothetical protein
MWNSVEVIRPVPEADAGLFAHQRLAAIGADHQRGGDRGTVVERQKCLVASDRHIATAGFDEPQPTRE